MPSAPTSIDDYLTRVPADRRSALEQLRRTIRAIQPKVEECISYSMPAFRLEGRVVAGFLATARGCSYYPFSGTTLATLAAELEGYSQTKSALHFYVGTPLPKALVRRLLAARIAEGSHAAPRAAARPAKKRRVEKKQRAGKARSLEKRATRRG